MRSVRTLFAVFSVHLLQSRHREWTAKYPKPFTTPSGRHIDVSLSTDGVTCATRIIYSVFMTGLSRLPPLLNVQEAMRVDSWVDRGDMFPIFWSRRYAVCCFPKFCCWGEAGISLSVKICLTLYYAQTPSCIGVCCRNFHEIQAVSSRENSRKCCHQMSDFKAEMHQIQFRLGLCPRTRWGRVRRLPIDPLTVFERVEEEKTRKGKGDSILPRSPPQTFSCGSMPLQKAVRSTLTWGGNYEIRTQWKDYRP